MSATGTSLNLIETPLRMVLVIAVLIAAVTPFDLAFATLTMGHWLVRALAMAAIVLLGGTWARAAGLRIAPADHRWVAGWAVVTLAVVAWVTLIDGLFRATLSPGYIAFIHQPLLVRYIYYGSRAFNESVLYRLFVYGGLMALVARLRGVPGQRAGWQTALACAVLSQSINIAINVVWGGGAPITLATLGYDALRYIVAGTAWALLVWRYSFLVSEAAAVGCHIILQPLLGAVV